MAYIKKINRGYQSVFEFLTARETIRKLPSDKPTTPINKIFAALYPDEYQRKNNPNPRAKHFRWRTHDFSEPTIGHKLLGSLQPFVDMSKDVVDTFHAYKTPKHAVWDALQPLRGLGNILKGILTIVAIPLSLTIGTIDAFRFVYTINKNLKSANKDIWRPMRMHFSRTLAWVPNAIATMLRGITQIAFTPLLPFKILLRAILTKRHGVQQLAQDRGVNQLLVEADLNEGNDKNLRSIDNELKRKSFKAQKQEREIPHELVGVLTEDCDPENIPPMRPSASLNYDPSEDMEFECDDLSPPINSANNRYRYIEFFRTATKASAVETTTLLDHEIRADRNSPIKG